MKFLLKVTPFPYAIIAFVFAIFGAINAIFLEGPHESFLNWTGALGTIYMWLSIAFAFTYVFMFIIQIAVLDLHQDEAYAYEGSKQRCVRLLLTLFMLALPPVSVMGINARYVAQTSWGHGFMSEGSLVYVACTLFLIMFFILWGFLQAVPRPEDPIYRV